MSLTLARRSDPALTAPALRDSGRPLDAATRSTFETGFGRDFSNIRVHDDAHAHDSARALNARAYAAGDHIVFGAGQYRPESASGRALIAHELAHTVQQAGLAMKADGPLPAGSDARLEAEADRAAVDVLAGRSAPALSRASMPNIFRADKNAPAPGSGAPSPARPKNIPEGFSIDTAAPPVANAPEVTIWLDKFVLPRPKGSGKWVQQAYDDVAAGKRLGTILMINGGSFAAWKEGSKTEEYRNQWLHRHGFNSFPQMAQAIIAANARKKNPLDVHPDVKKILPKLGKGLSAIKCDIDHIVEKQMGGTSQPSNLQLLTSDVNQESGREAYRKLKEHAQDFLAYSPDWKNVKRISMRIKAATVEAKPDDMSVKLEQLLRDNPQLGSAKVAASEDRKPLFLSAGGAGETVYVKDKGDCEIDEAGVRIVPGVKLSGYTRGVTKKLPDTVSGDLDHRAMMKSGTKEKNKGIVFQATVPAAAPTSAAAPDAAASAGAPATSNIPAGVEQRVLKLDKTKFKKLAFYYPYLSPGVINSVDTDSNGGLIGTGTIMPTVKFLGDLDFSFGPNELILKTTLDHNTLNKSAMMKGLSPVFRFTGGNFSLNLMNFVPSGTVSFSMGPATAPVMTGDLSAKVEGGAFVAVGTLTPGKLPGLSAAQGQITYNSDTGWAGSIHATTTTLPGATSADVTVGVRGGETIDFFGKGDITTKVRESTLKLGASWEGGGLRYWGVVKVPKPMPLVDSVELKGSYGNGLLNLTGEVKDFTWKNKFAGNLVVTYLQKDGEPGKFSGSVDAKTIGDTSKMDGHINLKLYEDGRVSGLGEVSYQVTKDIRPKLGVELIAGPTYRVRLFGAVTLGTIPLTGEWPKPGGEKKDILKGVGVKVSLPIAPVPGLSVYFQAYGSFGVTYGAGPLAIEGTKFDGELWPLEEDPKVNAKLTGRLAAPGFAGIYGTFGARLGAEMFAGALGINGGIDVTPSFRLGINAGIDVNASYSGESGFAFSAEAGVTTKLEAEIGFKLSAQIYGAYGLLEYTWSHPLGETVKKQLGPEFKVTLGKIAYSKDKGIVWPSLDQIDYSPKDFDPKSIITDLLTETKAQKA